MSEERLNMNYWATLSTGIAAFFLSIIWYSPFGIVHAGDWLMKMLFMGTVLSIWLNKKSLSKKMGDPVI